MENNSAKTSRNIIPSAFKGFDVGPVNLDFGGGKYDTATEFLKEKGVANLVFDPFNRPDEHNVQIMHEVVVNGCDSITCLNVLNVISESERTEIYKHLKMILATTRCKKIIFQVYTSNGSGIPEFTDSVNQNNYKISTYFSEVLMHFASFRVEEIAGKYIVVEKNFD